MIGVLLHRFLYSVSGSTKYNTLTPTNQLENANNIQQSAGEDTVMWYMCDTLAPSESRDIVSKALL